MIINKLRYKAINNKKIVFFLFGLAILAILAGSLFMVIISKSDQNVVKEYMNQFVSNINTINKIDTIVNTSITNIGFIIISWLLGISVIGVPIVLFMYFSKIFTLGFSISAFIMTYKLKGLLLAFIYIFPVHVINIVIYTLIVLYSIKMSSNLIYSIFKKKEVNFKLIINRYVYILFICLSISAICILYESFIIPFLISKLSFLT